MSSSVSRQRTKVTYSLSSPTSSCWKTDQSLITVTIQSNLLKMDGFCRQETPKGIRFGQLHSLRSVSSAKHCRWQKPASAFSRSEYFGAPKAYKNKLSSCSLAQLLV